MFTTNKARLCCAHLANCEAFKVKYMNEKVAELLSQLVSEDFHKNDDEEKTISESSSSTNYYNGHPMSHKDKAQFEHLLLQMIIFNRLSFAYIENEDTQAVFEFVYPKITLPSRKTIGEQ
ncbi:17636_t:CDS:2, partial [Cetraspora pellucida]